MKKVRLFASMFAALFLIAVLSPGGSALVISNEQSAQTPSEKQEAKEKKGGMGMRGDMPMCCKRKMSGKAKAGTTMESMDEQKGETKEVQDPVCGMKVDPKNAEKSVHKGKIYYFCSKADKEAFEKSPEKYLKKETDKKPS